MKRCSICGKRNADNFEFCVSCGWYLEEISLSKETTLDKRYNIICPIKSGGMGAVYKAEDKRLGGKLCAVKEMLDFSSNEEEKQKTVNHFEREAKILANLNHPSIPRVTDYFVEGERYYIIMDYIEGESLEQRLGRYIEELKTGLSEEEVIQYGIQVCEILEYLHSQRPQSVLHRDIKPANLIISKENNRVYLIDFGIARTITFTTRSTKTPVGTEGYAPLEQYQGQPETRSDIYALGATMHHLLTCKSPIPFMFDPVRKLRTELSEHSEAIIQKALAQEPEDRFSSAEDMKQALQGTLLCLQGLKSATCLPILNLGNESFSSPALKEWRMYRANLEHLGSSSSSFDPPFSLSWQVKTGNDVTSSPSVDGKVVYCGSNDFNLYALEADSGRTIWRFPCGGQLESSPAVMGGMIYIGSKDGFIYAIDTKGRLVWQYDTEDWVYSSPAEYQGTVYVGSCNRCLYALEAATGNLSWYFETGGWVYSSPAVVRGTVYFGSCDGYVYALDSKKGLLKWNFEVGDWVYSSPTVSNNTVFVGGKDGKIYAIDALSGNLRWSYQTEGEIWSSPALCDGVVYIGSRDGILYAINASTGKLRWKQQTSGGLDASPAATSDIVCIASKDRNLYIMSALSGEIMWRYEMGEQIVSSPALANGMIYIGSNTGYIYAFTSKGGY